MRGRPRLLIAGGSHSDIPLIKAASGLGYHVITTGNRQDDLGHRYSDEYVPADYSDREAMLELSERLKVDAICACCNDFSAISASYVAEKLGLGGHDPVATSELIHHKDSFRRFALENGLRVPLAIGFSSVGAALERISEFAFPVLVKPVDLSGGKGIQRVDEPARIEQALRAAFAASKAGRVVVEQYLTGSHHGFSAMLRDGKVAFHFCDNEHYYLNPYLVSAASTPSMVPGAVVDELVEMSEKVARLLSLKSGIFHVQFVLHNDVPYLIEICRRAPGDLYVDLVSLATGVDYGAWIVKSAAGKVNDDVRHREPGGCFTRHCIMPSGPGVLEEIHIDPAIEKNIVDSLVWGKPGDVVSNHLVHKFGIVFLQFGSTEEMLEKTDRMQSLVHARVR